jgi:hypothetical protein
LHHLYQYAAARKNKKKTITIHLVGLSCRAWLVVWYGAVGVSMAEVWCFRKRSTVFWWRRCDDKDNGGGAAAAINRMPGNGVLGGEGRRGELQGQTRTTSKERLDRCGWLVVVYVFVLLLLF